jgi:hypothetical protein
VPVVAARIDVVVRHDALVVAGAEDLSRDVHGVVAHETDAGFGATADEPALVVAEYLGPAIGVGGIAAQ